MRQVQVKSLKLNPKAVPEAVHEVLLAISLGCRDVRNSTLHSLRNIYFAYSWDKERKLYVQCRHNGGPLAAEQLAAIKLANATLDVVEAERELRDKTKAGGEARKPKPRFVAELDSKNFWSLLLDKMLAERMLKAKELASGGKFVDHGELPSIYAQTAVRRTVDEFSAFRQTIIAWLISRKKCGASDDGSGSPRPPGYSAKGVPATFEIDASQGLRAGGNLPRILEGNKLWTSAGKTGPVSPEAIATFNTFDFRSLIDKRMEAEGLPSGSLSLATVRVVPCRGKAGRIVKVEAVVKENFEVDDSSFLGKIIAKHPNFIGGAADEKLAVVKAMLSARAGRGKAAGFKEKLPTMAGMDLGLTNIGTIGFSNATIELPHELIAGRKAAQIIAKQQKKLDEVVGSKALGEVKRLREIQLKNDLLLDEVDRLKEAGSLSAEDEAALLAKKAVLSKKDIETLRAFQSDLYKDKDYLKALAQLDGFVDQTCHRVSRLVVDRLKSRGVELLVCGKNVGWKQESGFGRRMNRRFHSIPHARILQIIEYKAFIAGIAVVFQEESYTSKSSFVATDPLPVHGSEKPGKDQPFSGKRIGGVYTGPKHRMHADVNGALNILRKAVPRFSYTKRLHLGHRILGVGPGAGSPNGLQIVSGRPCPLSG